MSLFNTTCHELIIKKQDTNMKCIFFIDKLLNRDEKLNCENADGRENTTQSTSS